MNEHEIIRGEIDGKKKYCRIPIRSKFAQQIEGLDEITAEKILDMPREQASRIIDALVSDWMYWLKRANELYILAKGQEGKNDKAQD